MPGYVRFYGGVAEQQSFTLLAPVAGGSGVHRVSGFVWWYLASILFTVDNSGGAVTATPNVTVNEGSSGLYSVFGTALGALSAPVLIIAGLGLAQGTDGVSRSWFSLPLVPVSGDGSFTWGWGDGDAATFTSGATAVIVGERFLNKKLA